MQERHEADRKQGLVGDAGLGLVDLHERLRVAGFAQGDDHPPAWLQLIEQGLGDFRRGGGDDDAVERRLRRPADPAITDDRGDVGNAELGEAAVGSLLQLTPALDGEDVIAEMREDGCRASIRIMQQGSQWICPGVW